MKLNDKERKLLTILNEARLVKGELLKEYDKEVRKKFNFTNEELNIALEKFIKMDLLEEINLKKDGKLYMHTPKCTENLMDEELINIGR